MTAHTLPLRTLAALVNAAAWVADRALSTALCERLICDFPNRTDGEGDA